MGKILITFIFTALSVHAQTVEFEQDVRIKKENQNVFEEIKSGGKIKLKPSESIFVISNKNLPLLILSPNSSSSQITISNSNLESVIQEQMQNTLNKSANEIVNELRKTENLLQKKDYTQALNGITQLKNKYNGISAIYFMSGTVYYLLNNKNAAAEELEKGLKIDPTNEAAQKLLIKLKGASL